ncbi:hypothetical protein BG53_05255 [Paenibacillus darwinianus]|uniref:General stress protein 17M-like domain-containing protein n=1 Tax=Paenibacillus darwinianus TaxID=1380763 RepID=A0A9W5S0K6_9BACL|nr:general stress protein [Paenibacillus darwinianus]EXX85158.1 hypothetical protein BG52_09055 [Paenibacillus darwinianus]EXX86786.1 hypothetical protein CH50_06630 [Paenibacillus darwinianus]EXX86799.1 hypothetical protein BG53_05255 [Paenibacillus darwinianus]
MSMAIGIFSNQAAAIEAVQLLEGAGFRPDEMKVVAKDRESSGRIESETDVHVDELNDLTDARADRSGGDIPLDSPAAAGWAAGFPAGLGLGTYNGTGYPAGVLAYTALNDGGSGMKGALHALGLGDTAAEVCRDAIREGSIVVVAEADGDDSVRKGSAEDVFRRTGAAQII